MRRRSIWLDIRRSNGRVEGVGTQGEQSVVLVVASWNDKRPVRGAKRVVRVGEYKRAGRRGSDRAVGNSEPAERADKVVSSSSSAEDVALREPIGR